MKKILPYLISFVCGFFLVFLIIKFGFTSTSTPATIIKNTASFIGLSEHQVIGFLPYWLISQATKDYSPYVNDITYFGLTIAPDGSIQKYSKPGETEPGWFALQSGKFVPPTSVHATLLAFSGDPDAINELMSDPITHATTFVSEITPIMEQYNFTKLNIDIENVQPASPAAQQNFTAFIKEVKQQLKKPIYIDASPTDLIKERLINLSQVAPYVDGVILMTYDYHFAGSYVTGPVAPVAGAGMYSEFDVETGIQKALAVMPKEKIILGIPLYGYSWETITNVPRAAAIPGSGVVISNKRAEEFIAACATCSAQREQDANESYVIYQDSETGTYHQFFYPDAVATQAKINLAKKYELGGVAFWALGYEGDTILNPAKAYKDALK